MVFFLKLGKIKKTIAIGRIRKNCKENVQFGEIKQDGPNTT